MTQTAPSQNNVPVKLPIFHTIFGCYMTLIDKVRPFVFFGTFFSLILMCLCFATGQDSLCINDLYRQNHYCTENLSQYFVVHLVILFILAVFMRIWTQTALQNRPFNWKSTFIPQRADLKIFALFFIFFATIVVAVTSAYFLYIRVPNPDWRIELAYFGVVGLGFFVPLIALRFLVYFAYAAINAPFPTLKAVWQKTSGNGFALLAGFILLMMVGLLCTFSVSQRLLMLQVVDPFYIAVGADYLADMLLLLVAACFMNYCYIQYQTLSEQNSSERS